MSRDFYSDPPTVKGWEGSLCLYSDSRVAHCFRGLQNTAILHQEPRPRERVSPDPPPPMPPPATGGRSPHCPAGCIWLPRLSRARVPDQLVLRRLGPTLRTGWRSAGSEGGKRPAGPPPLPRRAVRMWARDPGFYLPASCLGAFSTGARRPYGRGLLPAPTRAGRLGGARGGGAPPPQAGRWSAACAALPSPTPLCAPQSWACGAHCEACAPRGGSVGRGQIRADCISAGPAGPRRVFCVCTHRERRREEWAGGARGRSERAPTNERAGGGEGRGARGPGAGPSLPSIVCDWLARGAGRGGVCRGKPRCQPSFNCVRSLRRAAAAL